MACLLLSAAFAAWTWLRPYDFRPDPAARCEVIETLVTRDQSFFWVHVHLKVIPGMRHDLQIPVTLATANGPKQPADTTFAGTDPLNPEEIWFKFWLDSSDLAGPLNLELNGGKLSVKAHPHTPDLGSDAFQNFTTNHW
ncbi:MAG: hypothetical protein V4689_14815 [Verrucomicrobiota bacterium]